MIFFLYNTLGRCETQIDAVKYSAYLRCTLGIFLGFWGHWHGRYGKSSNHVVGSGVLIGERWAPIIALGLVLLADGV